MCVIPTDGNRQWEDTCVCTMRFFQLQLVIIIPMVIVNDNVEFEFHVHDRDTIFPTAVDFQ